MNISEHADETWAGGDESLSMIMNLRQGDVRTLNLFFVEKTFDYSLGFTTPVEKLSQEPSRYLADGCILQIRTLREMSRWGGKVAVHEVGHWLGLAHPDASRDCVEDSDGLQDTPVSNKDHNCPVTARIINGSNNSVVHNYMSRSNEYVSHTRRLTFTQLQWNI